MNSTDVLITWSASFDPKPAVSFDLPSCLERVC